MAMATRTIVTSQPDVSCDVCERRLLRGEQPDVFLAAGRRRTVCELCAPRAAHEGWMRESDSHSLKLPPMRTRRGRSFFERLRQVGKPPLAPGATDAAGADGEPYDFLDGYEPAGAQPASARGRAAEAEHYDDAAEHHVDGESRLPVAASPAARAAKPQAETYIDLAIDVFNMSEYPRRLAGVARSLGAPVVNVRSAEHLESVVLVVVAWELCWYRYEVDLSEATATTQLLVQGTELEELTREERVGNAVADESGLLSAALL
jgi:hypothetical protein